MQTKNTELEKKYGALGIADIVAKRLLKWKRRWNLNSRKIRSVEIQSQRLPELL